MPSVFFAFDRKFSLNDDYAEDHWVKLGLFALWMPKIMQIVLSWHRKC